MTQPHQPRVQRARPGIWRRAWPLLLGSGVAALIAACSDSPTATGKTEPPNRLRPTSPLFEVGGWVPGGDRCAADIPPETYYSAQPFLKCKPTFTTGQPGQGTIVGGSPSPLVLTFSEPIYNVVLEGSGVMKCGDYGYAVATTAAGETDTSRFQLYFLDECDVPPGSGNDDAVGWIVMRDTLAPGKGVIKVEVYPPSPYSWVNAGLPETQYARTAYTVYFDRFNPCPPVGDPVLDRPEFRKVADSLLKLSNISDPKPENRRERAAKVWQDRITDAIRFEILDVVGTACVISPGTAADTDAEKLIAVIHTHPHFIGENIKVACNNPLAPPYDPRFRGGGSEADWTYANQSFRDVYAISPQYIHRLDWDVPQSEWGKFPVRWRRDRNTHCPVR
jgi:hypothetical protein